MRLARRLILALLGLFLTACSPTQHTETGWIYQTTPYNTTILEIIDGSESSGLDLGAAIGSEWRAIDVEITRIIGPDGSGQLTIKAGEFSTFRAPTLLANAEQIRAANEQFKSLVEAINAATKFVVPVPTVEIGGE